MAGLARIMPQLFNELANHLTPILLHKGMVLEEAEAERGRARRQAAPVGGAREALAAAPAHAPVPGRAPPGERATSTTWCRRPPGPGSGSRGGRGDPGVHPGPEPAALRPGPGHDPGRAGLPAPPRIAAARQRHGTAPAGRAPARAGRCSGWSATTPGRPEGTEAGDRLSIYPRRGTWSPWACASSPASPGPMAAGSRSAARKAWGTRFSWSCPWLSPGPDSASLQGKKVLVVDDEAFLLECLVDAIGSWGARRLPAPRAPRPSRSSRPGATIWIVSDIRMPGLNGIQLYDGSRRTAAHGRPDPVHHRRFLRSDTHAFLERARSRTWASRST